MKSDPFANLPRNVIKALDAIVAKPILHYGEVQRIAFDHNASFFAVKSNLPAYRAWKAAARGDCSPFAPPPMPTPPQATSSTLMPRKWKKSHM